MKEDEIIDIVIKGTLDNVRNLIKENETILSQRFVNYNNRNILHFAAGNSDPLVIIELLKYADSNALDDNDLMPIHIAAICGNFPVICALMKVLTKDQLPTIKKDLVLYLKLNDFVSLVPDVESLLETLNLSSVAYPSPTIPIPSDKTPYPGFFQTISSYFWGSTDNTRQFTDYSSHPLEIKKVL